MNDPGLDDAIGSEAQAVENEKEGAKQDEAEEDEQAFLEPSRWWFASTAFPLIAGTFGPMASAFSICALVVPWRVEVADGQTEAYGTYVNDPSWLIGINATQLAIAIISNLFLLLNMARRVRFSIAQPITIVGWFISSFALLALCSTAAGPLRLQYPPAHALSQAFYYGAFSAGLYFIVAFLMMITVIGAHMGKYEKEFQLTMSQRTLMLQTISFLIYLLCGATVFAHIESWSFLDAVYFTDFTLLTVGIGDLSPATDLARGLLFPYAIGGIIIIGLVIGSIRGLVLDRGKVKLTARMVEKERELLVKRVQRKCEYLLEPIKFDQSQEPRDSATDSDEPNERQRREMEFDMMRKVQEKAAMIRRWTSLAISAATWLALWFVGAAVFQATEVASDWSYFTALYFSYTSLLTIGYGDISPSSNAGKPFFVFWSLLAIPSLTILISNMGDTIVKMIRDLTLWIGNVTVLPGEHGARKGLKEAARTLTHNKIFGGAKIGEMPPGILGEMNDREPGNDDDREGGGGSTKKFKNDPESAAQHAAGNQADIEAKRAKQESETGDQRAIPESKVHYFSLLIKEINNVMRHLNSSPPRKYTFDEWAWYLRLIGEDESRADTHRKPVQKPNPDSDESGATMGRRLDEGKKIKWSWVGPRSPLMGNKEEAEWVLERLTRTLDRELEAMKKEAEEGEGDWKKGGKMEKFAKKHRRERREGDRDGDEDGDDEVGKDSDTDKDKDVSREQEQEAG